MMVALRIVQRNEKSRASSKKNKIDKKRGCYKVQKNCRTNNLDTFGTNKIYFWDKKKIEHNHESSRL